MDDPWGSPWASADTSSNTDPPPSHANTFLSPPPRAFFGNATGSPSHSPWSSNQDDNGSSAWTTTDSLDAPNSQSEWGAWAESGAQGPRFSPSLSVSGKESPLPWPENAAASSVMLANSRSRTPSLFRHHSPDPWASELALRSDSDTIPRYPSTSTASGTPTIETAQFAEIPNTPQPAKNDGAVQTLETEGSPTKGQAASQRTASVGTDGLANDTGVADRPTGTSSKLEKGVSELPSRRSSTFSLDSHDGLDRQDSPITSIDEDRASQVQSTLRKSSGKVQELVGVYDGLTRAASEEPPPLDRCGTSRTRDHEDLSAQTGTAKSGEVGLSDTQVVSFHDQLDSSLSGESLPTSELSSTPEAELKEEEFIQSTQRGKEVVRIADQDMTPVRTQPPAKSSDTVSFDINLALLDQLFPNITQPPEGTFTEDTGVSEHVINDSFTTISERKAWYRISRYGSMRKHNSGDDENYHRVTWPTSQLHDEAIKIVRRWMEEDSYAGKATLGGTKRTGFFDWDSDAAPVELEKVFRRRGSVIKHTRTASIPAPANNAANQVLSVDKRMYRNSTGISLPAGGRNPLPPSGLNTPMASFGWTSEPQQDSPMDRLPQSSGQVQKPLEGRDHSTSVATPGTIQAMPPDEDEGEDDWGEMVSSPHMAEFSAQTKLSTFPGPRTTSENFVSTLTGSQSVTSSDLQPGSSTRSEILVLQKSRVMLKSPDEHVSHQLASFTALEPSSAGSKADSHRQTSKPSIVYEIPKESIGAFQTATEGDLHQSLEPNNTRASDTRVDVPENQNEDDIIVQRILQNLPDLSYMLR